MSFYTLLLIAIGIFAMIGITAFFFFIQWLDKKIDMKDRLGKKERWENRNHSKDLTE